MPSGEHLRTLKKGRPKGALNLKSRVLSEDLKRLAIDPVAGLKDCLQTLDTIKPRHVGDEINLLKIRIDLFSNFLPYLYSRLMSQEPPNLHNPWSQMSASQKLETLKPYQHMLEQEIKAAQKETVN
jgi:hypothetical protein